MVFNGSGVTGGDGFLTVMSGANDLAGGFIGTFFLFLVWLVVYFKLRGEPTREAAVAAFFVTFIAALLMTLIDLVDKGVLAITIVLLIGSIVMLFIRE